MDSKLMTLIVKKTGVLVLLTNGVAFRWSWVRVYYCSDTGLAKCKAFTALEIDFATSRLSFTYLRSL